MKQISAGNFHLAKSISVCVTPALPQFLLQSVVVVVVVGWIQMCRCESTFGRSRLAININIKIAHQVGHHHFVHSHVATELTTIHP